MRIELTAPFIQDHLIRFPEKEVNSISFPVAVASLSQSDDEVVADAVAAAVASLSQSCDEVVAVATVAEAEELQQILEVEERWWVMVMGLEL